jgi:predicted glycosyltransferase involved in capsule biosynthesis
MNSFGLCYPVYNNQKAFDDIKGILSQLPCSITIVDDGSEFPLDVGGLTKLNLIRLEKQRIWNQAQANNVAISNADAKIILRMDIDHYISVEDFEKFLSLAQNFPDKTIYQFHRFRFDTQKFINTGCNIIMLKKQDFIDIGKYNEAFCGNYGYEDLEFQYRAKKMGFKLELYPLTVYVNAKNKTPNMTRDTTINKELYRKLTQI